MSGEDRMLYSILLEVRASHQVSLPLTTGPQVHALFLRLLTRDDPSLFARLHEASGPRPFTLSQLLGATIDQGHLLLKPGQICSIRITLMDQGEIWESLITHILEAGPINIQLGCADLTLYRLRIDPATDQTGRVSRTSWQSLMECAPRSRLSLCFASPTAFNISGKYYALFPEPLLVWESLLRAWNCHAPEQWHIEKEELRPLIQKHVHVFSCKNLTTHTLPYPNYTQKGFTGTCSYEIGGLQSLSRYSLPLLSLLDMQVWDIEQPGEWGKYILCCLQDSLCERLWWIDCMYSLSRTLRRAFKGKVEKNCQKNMV